jgi:hypothetical protein
MKRIPAPLPDILFYRANCLRVHLLENVNKAQANIVILTLKLLNRKVVLPRPTRSPSQAILVLRIERI